jgi:hypothetical protein
MIPKSLLHGMQLAIIGQTFDRGNIAPIGLYSQHSTRFDAHAIQMYGAGAALARIAAYIRACQSKYIS